MNTAYFYDVEIYPNLFELTFIPADVEQQLIDVYISIDKLNLRDKHLNKTDNLEKYKKDKNTLLQAMGARQFIIFLDYKTGEWRNDGAFIMDFFIQHKTLTGYNSNNYDRFMLDVFINNYRYCDARGYNKKEGKHITQILFDHSTSCIQFGKGYGKLLKFKKFYKPPYTDYDIQKILYLDKTFTSLKQVAICLKWYRIQNLPIEFDRAIKPHEIYDICDYNVNDVLITLALTRNQKGEIELREDISNEFDIDVRNMSRSSIGKAITTELYEKFSGIPRKDFIEKKTDRWKINVASVLSDKIRFETRILNELLDKVRKSVIVVGSKEDKDKFKHEFKFGDTVYTMALGGLHSQDDPAIFDIYDTSHEEYILRDADVASYYPNGILSYDVYPAHLERIPFRATVGYTKDTRVEAKHTSGKLGKEAKKVLNDLHDAEAQRRSPEEIAELNARYEDLRDQSKRFKTKAEGLKIAINRMYGAFRDVNDYLYDPKCTYKVTINLQLCLLMLIEKLELSGIKVISANTDGIVCKILPHQENDYKKCCDWWQEYNNFELEFTDYEKYLRNDVNNYIAIKKGFKEAYTKLVDKSPENLKEIEDAYIKRKGLFIEDIVFNKGYAYPVVPKALNLHFIYDIPYRETILNHINSSKDAIYDYCMSQKTDAKFTIIYKHIVDGKVVSENLQKSNRFYMTKVSNGSGSIVKYDPNSGRNNRIVAKYSVKPFNDYIEEENYDIDFSFYLNECHKILYGKNKKTEGMVAIQGDLFGSMTTTNHLELSDPIPASEGLIDVDLDEINYEIDQFEINNTEWGMMGYESKEAYIKALGLDDKSLREVGDQPSLPNGSAERSEALPNVQLVDPYYDEEDIPF